MFFKCLLGYIKNNGSQNSSIPKIVPVDNSNNMLNINIIGINISLFLISCILLYKARNIKTHKNNEKKIPKVISISRKKLCGYVPLNGPSKILKCEPKKGWSNICLIA